MNRTKLNSGVNAILIAYLRENGGSVQVDSVELGCSNGLFHRSIYAATRLLERRGLVTIQKEGYGTLPIITLNEEAIKRFESGNSSATSTAVTKSQKQRSAKGGIFNELSGLLKGLEKHKFRESSLVEPLFVVAKSFLAKLAELHLCLEIVRLENVKLREAISGFSLTEQEIEKEENVSAEEIAVAVVYDEFRLIPSIEFIKLLTEPAGIFKPLAELYVKTVEARNLFIELQREAMKQKLAQDKLKTLLENEQASRREMEAQKVELNLRLSEHKKLADKVVQARLGGIVVVSTRE